MSGRLPTHLTVAALLRRVNDAGGIAVVRARGEPDAGALLLIVEGDEPRVLERGIGPDGGESLIESRRGEGIEDYWQKRRRSDPDLWVVALDIPQADRFAAETIGLY